MSRNGVGVYQLPSPPSPYLNSTTADATQLNQTLNDIAAALTQSWSADGQTPVTGNLNMGGHSITNASAIHGTTGTFSSTGNFSGNLSCGNPAAGAGTQGVVFNPLGTGTFYAIGTQPLTVGTGGTALVGFTSGATPVGSITTTGGTTFYNTTSDANLKTDEGAILGSDAAAYIERLRPLWYRWRDNPNATPMPGFTAQQWQEAMPWGVTRGTGNPDEPGYRPWQLDASKALPFLVSTVQWLLERVRTLEARP